ncbi:MAG: FecR domain-containing protein [Rhodospirillales bacterium]
MKSVGYDTSAGLGPASASGFEPLTLKAAAGESMKIPGGSWVLRARFFLKDLHLVLAGEDGKSVIIRGYYKLDDPPALMTENGAMISAELAKRLAVPLDPDPDAAAEPAARGEPIGHIDTVTGKVQMTHGDGAMEACSNGAPVFKGNVLRTESHGTVGVILADESAFSLGEKGRLSLDGTALDPATQAASATLSLVQGAFTFVSGPAGEAASAMVVTTPAARVGIRGAASGLIVDAEGATTAALMAEKDGSTNEMIISNPAGAQTINRPSQAVSVSTFKSPPSKPFAMTMEEMCDQFSPYTFRT